MRGVVARAHAINCSLGIELSEEVREGKVRHMGRIKSPGFDEGRVYSKLKADFFFSKRNPGFLSGFLVNSVERGCFLSLIKEPIVNIIRLGVFPKTGGRKELR